MDPNSPFRDPNYWLKRAEETRAKAESFSSRHLKDRLLRIAEEYEQLAFRAENLQTPRPLE